MDINFNSNQNLSCTPFNSLGSCHQQFTAPNYYVIYQTHFFPNIQITDVYDQKTNSQMSKFLQGQTQISNIQNNISLNSQNISFNSNSIPQFNHVTQDIKLNFQTSSEKSCHSHSQNKGAISEDQVNYQNLINNVLNIDSKYQNQSVNQHSYLNDMNNKSQISYYQNGDVKLSKIINQKEQCQNSDNTLYNQFKDCQLSSQQTTAIQFNHNNLESNETNIQQEKLINSQNYNFQKASDQYGYKDQKQNKNLEIPQKMEIENNISQCTEGTQKQQSEISKCLTLNSFPDLSVKNNEKIQQQSNIFQIGHNQLNSSISMIQINSSNQKQCKYKQIEGENVNQLSSKRGIESSQHSQNFNFSQLSTENKISKEIKLDVNQTSIFLDSNKQLDTLQIKKQSPQVVDSYQQQYSLNKNQVQKLNNKIKIKQEKILNKLINGQPIKEESIIQKYNTQDAFDIIKSSIFNLRKEMIFEQKHTPSFKLKLSITKNNEIVFASIKESRRNNRYQNKNNSALNSINLNTNISQQCEENIKQGSQSEDNDKCSSSNESVKNYDFPLQVNKLQNKKFKAPSKFHNLKKLFMYKLVATFNLNNMIDIGVPEFLREILLKLIVRFKISAKKSEELNRKTEFFSQAHYNALFLYLNQQTICLLAKNKFEVYLHKVIYQIDLEQISENFQKKQMSNNQRKQTLNVNEPFKSINSILIEEEDNFEEKIQYINILKRYCYQIVKSSNMFGVNCQEKQSIDDINAPNQSQELKQFNQQENMRMAYTSRALQGISNLSRGIFIKKF